MGALDPVALVDGSTFLDKHDPTHTDCDKPDQPLTEVDWFPDLPEWVALLPDALGPQEKLLCSEWDEDGLDWLLPKLPWAKKRRKDGNVALEAILGSAFGAAGGVGSGGGGGGSSGGGGSPPGPGPSTATVGGINLYDRQRNRVAQRPF